MPYRWRTDTLSAVVIGGMSPKASSRGKHRHSPASCAVLQAKQGRHQKAKQPVKKKKSHIYASQWENVSHWGLVQISFLEHASLLKVYTRYCCRKIVKKKSEWFRISVSMSPVIWGCHWFALSHGASRLVMHKYFTTHLQSAICWSS